jgi:hypothetical protein
VEECRKIIEARQEKLIAKRTETLKYFLESSAMATETFFTIFNEFLTDFEVW